MGWRSGLLNKADAKGLPSCLPSARRTCRGWWQKIAFGRSVFAGNQASPIPVTQVTESTTTLSCQRLGAGTRVDGCGSKSCKQTAHKKEVHPEALGHGCISGRKVDGCFMEAGATFDGFGWRVWISESSHWMQLASGNTQVVCFSFGGFWLY